MTLMKTILNPLFLLVSIASIGFLTACEDDETTAKPVIVLHELGIDNSHEAHIGGDLHIDAEIVAEGKIAKIVIELHSESSDNEIEVEFVDGYEGLKNAEFHEHVEIPETFMTGEYHFHLVVTDMEGNQAIMEEHVDIE